MSEVNSHPFKIIFKNSLFFHQASLCLLFVFHAGHLRQNVILIHLEAIIKGFVHFLICDKHISLASRNLSFLDFGNFPLKSSILILVQTSQLIQLFLRQRFEKPVHFDQGSLCQCVTLHRCGPYGLPKVGQGSFLIFSRLSYSHMQKALQIVEVLI